MEHLAGQRPGAALTRIAATALVGLAALCACAGPDAGNREQGKGAADRVGWPLTKEQLDQARLQARFRRRRIIMNNDGNDNPVDPVTPASFLARRTTPLVDSQVDSIFYCTGVNNLYTHRSTVSEQMGVRWKIKNKGWVARLTAQNTDSLAIMVDWCKRNGREVFWSMRMNDRHDTSRKNRHLLCQWGQKSL